ncbi:MAG: hypothetical protein KIG37_07735 [Oscillospiraceae bacterium]|nr:hypothetical protein [Oscillospiraceae bacterium]
MAFTPLSVNVKNIEGLGTDKPNTDLNMSGLQLRQRFDKAVTDIKAWINDVFLAEIAGTGGAGNIGMTQVQGLNATNVQAALSELYTHTGDVKDSSVTVDKLADDFKLPEEHIAESAVTRSKLAQDAFYSPVEYFDGAHTLSTADIGKTLASSSTGENIVTLTTAASAAMPIGAEIAVFWMAGTSLKLQFTGTMRIVMPGEDVLVNGSLQLSEKFTLVALKKIQIDVANGDIWTVQGDVEVAI